MGERAAATLCSPRRVRLRIGVVFWLLSWVPFGIIFGVRGAWLPVVWTLEVLLGLAGVALAGSAFFAATKACGF